MAIKLEFIDRVIKVSKAVACLLGGLVALYDLLSGLALLAGGLWGAYNLYFIMQLMKSLVGARKRALWTLIKFPLLYLAGYMLLKMLPALYLLAGFTICLLVLVLMALWQQFRRERA